MCGSFKAGPFTSPDLDLNYESLFHSVTFGATYQVSNGPK